MGENVQSQQTPLVQLVIGEAYDNEDDGQENEPAHLDRFSADRINGGNSDPVTGNGTGANNDQIADSTAVEDLENVVTLGESDSRQDDGIVQTKTIKGDL